MRISIRQNNSRCSFFDQWTRVVWWSLTPPRRREGSWIMRLSVKARPVRTPASVTQVACDQMVSHIQVQLQHLAKQKVWLSSWIRIGLFIKYHNIMRRDWIRWQPYSDKLCERIFCGSGGIKIVMNFHQCFHLKFNHEVTLPHTHHKLVLIPVGINLLKTKLLAAPHKLPIKWLILKKVLRREKICPKSGEISFQLFRRLLINW